MARLEHLHWDLTPAAVEQLGFAIDNHLVPGSGIEQSVWLEMQNLGNECRARVQHAAAGIPDRSDVLIARHSEEERGDGPGGEANPLPPASLQTELAEGTAAGRASPDALGKKSAITDPGTIQRGWLE